MKDISPEALLLNRFKTLTVVGLIAGAIVVFIIHNIVYANKPQPIAFPHDLHAGDRKINCAFCHVGVATSDVAGVPSVSDCMQCHQVVDSPNPRGKEELKKLRKYWADKDSIKWFKVYNMPEHVKFSHRAHIQRGFECNVCHGDVAKMKVVTAGGFSGYGPHGARNPTMGFCVDCHRRNKGPVDCTACHY